MENKLYFKGLLSGLLLFLFVSGLSAQNYAVRFDGNDDQMTVTPSAAFDIGENFTIEAWISAASWKAESWQGSILAKDMQGPNSGFAFRCGKNGTLSFVMSTDQDWREIQSSPFMNTNQWYHVAVVVKGSTMTLFINGGQVASGPKNGTNTPNSILVSIGESSGFPGRVFDGAIDEIRVWDVARTAQELKDNQTTEFTGNEAGMIAYYPMNEGSGLMTANLSSPSQPANFNNNMDETAWVEGYSIPNVDVGATNILAPDVLSTYQRPVQARVSVQNFGSEAVSDIPLTLTVNGLPVLEETMEGTLEPGASKEYTFKGILDLADRNTNNVVVSTKHPDDANPLNDNFSFRYQRPDEGKFINIIKNEQHNFGSAGQSQLTNVLLPEDIDRFEKLLMHIDLDCPGGGCDPWDQPAKISIVQGDDEFEIARFITPYGISCGPWTVDVTDFKTLLTGAVQFKSFVQVWGTSGWLVTVDLELIGGANPYPFQKLTPLWLEDNWVYGDPGYDDDLPAVDMTPAMNTNAAHMRMTITGHGQGNTNNAAEFSDQTHTVMIDGNEMMAHRLWKADCGQNSCSGQAGNWRPSRAGWCPGEAVEPLIVNMTNEITGGVQASIDYELEEYTNLLNTGYNDGSHTQPHYRIWSYLIEKSASRYDDYSNLKARSVRIVTNGDVNNPVYEKVRLMLENTGSEPITNPMLSYYINGEWVFSEMATTTVNPGATFMHEFAETKGFTAGEDHIVYGVVEHPNDANINDNISKTEIYSDLTTSLVELAEVESELWPNPTVDGQMTLRWDRNFNAKQIDIYDYSGRLLESQSPNGNEASLQFEKAGMYSIVVKDATGHGFVKKAVVLE